jgi:hypothetical protein
MPADYFDLAQSAAMILYDLLSLDNPTAGGGLGNLLLGAGLLNQDEIRGVGIPALVVALSHSF